MATKFHKLLEKQIKRNIPEAMMNDESLMRFFEAINDSYNAYEKDKELSTHAFAISELEYRDINTQLSKEIEQKKLSINKLKETILAIDSESEVAKNKDNDDILIITEYLTNQLNKRKQAEDELFKSAYLITSLLQNLHAGILVENENREIVLTNQRFCSMFSIPANPDDLIGVDCSQSAEQSKVLFKDPECFVKSVELLLKEKKVVTNEGVELADGSFYERDYIPIYIDDVYKGHLWMYRDITERKLAETKIRLKEEKYRSIIANMNLGLIEVDLEEHIKYVNQSFCDMSGFSVEELQGNVASEILPLGESKDIVQQKNKVRTIGVSDTYEVSIKNKKGEPRWWLISGAPLYNDRKELMGSIGIHLDITEQKVLEIKLKEAKIVAENSARAKDVFLTNMSHEIRTPMNAIIGMGRQLQKTNLQTEQQSYLSTINNAADNLLVIINDILDFSKIEAGKIVLENIGFDLRKIIDHSLQIIKHHAEEKGLGVSVSLSDFIAPVFKGDPFRINQVLMNLLSNAVKFTEKGTVGIACEVSSSSPIIQQLTISITDTGIGMDDVFLETIYQKFSQEDESVARRYGGTGLGMSISKQLVELMGGTIHVTSKKNIGTTVTIKLELPIGTAIDIQTNNNDKIETAILKGKKVLLVEDNEMNRLVANAILKQYGVTVIEAYNGLESITYLKSNNADIVLMDVRMPVMDGLEATKQIRSLLKKTNLPIIALTANTVKGEQEKCMEAGMNDYLGKPFEEAELIGKIAKWLNESTASDNGSKAALYSLDKLKSIGRNDEGFIKKMLGVFVKETTNAVSTIQQAYASKDFETVRQTAHRIKPSLENMGIDSLYHDIREIENIDSANQIRLAANIQKLETIITAIVLDINERG